MKVCDTCASTFKNAPFSKEQFLSRMHHCPIASCDGRIYEIDEPLRYAYTTCVKLGLKPDICCSGHLIDSPNANYSQIPPYFSLRNVTCPEVCHYIEHYVFPLWYVITKETDEPRKVLVTVKKQACVETRTDTRHVIRFSPDVWKDAKNPLVVTENIHSFAKAITIFVVDLANELHKLDIVNFKNKQQRI